MNNFVGMNLVFIVIAVVSMLKYYKGTPKYNTLELRFYLSLSKKRQVPTYLGYVALTLYLIYQYYGAIIGKVMNVVIVTDLLFVTLVYFIFMNLIPRAYGICDKGVYSYGIIKRMGKLYKWEEMVDVNINDIGEVAFSVESAGRKSKINGIVDITMKDELMKAIKSFQS